MMELFLKFDINFFSVVMLLLIVMIMSQRRDTMSYSSRLFKMLIIVNIYMLLLEVVSWQFDTLPGSFNWYANYMSNMIFAWSTPLITCVWACYMDYRMFGSVERLKRRLFYSHPIIANTVLIIINLFTPLVFSVSVDNVYAREPGMWLIVLINSMTLFYICYLAYANRSMIQRRIIYVVLMFVCLPAIAAGLQVMLYGVFIMWPMMAVTLVITYIYLETASTSFDYLTGLYSRLRLDEYIDYMISTNQKFGVIMLDLNDFKSINDNYGHHRGDGALVIFSNVLMKVFGSEKMTARFAGDEFLVVTHKLSDEDLGKYKARLAEVVHSRTRNAGVEYDIEFSLGYCAADEFEETSYEKIINCADERMYKDKALTKGTAVNSCNIT